MCSGSICRKLQDPTSPQPCGPRHPVWIRICSKTETQKGFKSRCVCISFGYRKQLVRKEGSEFHTRWNFFFSNLKFWGAHGPVYKTHCSIVEKESVRIEPLKSLTEAARDICNIKEHAEKTILSNPHIRTLGPPGSSLQLLTPVFNTVSLLIQTNVLCYLGVGSRGTLNK